MHVAMRSSSNAAGNTPLASARTRAGIPNQGNTDGALFATILHSSRKTTIHTVVLLQLTKAMPEQCSKQYFVSRRAGYGFPDLITALPEQTATVCVVEASRKTTGRN